MPRVVNASATTSAYVNTMIEPTINVDVSIISRIFIFDIVNEIFENAMEKATTKSNLTNPVENLCNTTYKKTLKDDTSFLKHIHNNMSSNLNYDQEKNIRELVEGICLNTKINLNADVPSRIDVETKRFVNEIMSPTTDTTTFENAIRNNGVGDQSNDVDQSNINDRFKKPCSDDNTRIVEKKSRVTDLVMNSKQVLTQIFLNDDEKKKQDEWEESRENVIQVINLECVQPRDMDKLIENVKITSIDTINEDNRENDDDEDNESFTPIPKDDTLESIDLTIETHNDDDKMKCLNEKEDGGKGDDFKETCTEDLIPRSSKSLPSSSAQSHSQLSDELRKEKRKKWNLNKIWNLFIKKHKRSSDEKNANVEKRN